MRTLLLVLPVFVVVAPAASHAQSMSMLSGRVHGTAPCIVELHTADGVVDRVTTDIDGEFQFAVAPGHYDVVATDGTLVATTTVNIGTSPTRVELDLVAAPSTTPEVIHVESSRPSQVAERTAEAVRVVSTEQARKQTADLGEVMARTEGVAVRRSAGLGSTARFSLDGLYDEQIRFFLDEVPLDIAGFPFGIVNVPVNLIDRVEIFRGVVPIRFGADALGGAVNLLAAKPAGTHASASYQVGSFGTHRATAAVSHQDDELRLDESASAFVDRARNNYEVAVQAPDDKGQLHDVVVPRFHDGYRAAGANVELVLRDRRWTDRLELRGFYTGYAKDLQSNAVMSVPYGEVTYGEHVGGATTRYRVTLPGALKLDALAAYAHRRISFHDASLAIYDWFGDRVGTRKKGGELDGTPHDEFYWQDTAFGRVLLARRISVGEIRLVASPQVAWRTGADHARTSTGRDPLSAKHRRTALVGGGEWELDADEDRLENIAFAKTYLFRATYEDVRPGAIFVELASDSLTFGGGDGIRYRVLPWLDLKASYEYATRLPSTDELFGDGVLVGPSPTLAPETSHNVNIGPRIELVDPSYGEFAIQVAGFWRGSKNLIVLLGSQQYLTYQNVYDANALGVDGSVAWSSPGRWLTIDAGSSYLDLRNASAEGTFGTFHGDRIPNRPYLFGSLGVRGRVTASAVTVEPFYVGRYVHSFLRGWESLGVPEFQQVIAAQLAHDLGVSFSGVFAATRWSVTAEVDNVTNARLFDSYGAQRPGRAYYLKLTADL